VASGVDRATSVTGIATPPDSDRRVEAWQGRRRRLLFNVPNVSVFLLAGDECIARHQSSLRARPWVRTIPVHGDDLRAAFEGLKSGEGIQRVSAIGGRFTATRLVDAGLIQDIYLTTTSLEGGEPDTPWYVGAIPPRITAVTSKQWDEDGSRVVFEHCLISR
jgi:hypothetical protein